MHFVDSVSEVSQQGAVGAILLDPGDEGCRLAVLVGVFVSNFQSVAVVLEAGLIGQEQAWANLVAFELAEDLLAGVFRYPVQVEQDVGVQRDSGCGDEIAVLVVIGGVPLTEHLTHCVLLP